MIYLQNLEDLEKYISENKILLVQYSTSTCTACDSLEYKIDKYLEQNKSCNAVYVQIEKFPKVKSEKQIFTSPTIELYINSKLSLRKGGYFSLEEIFRKIEYFQEIQRN